MNCFFCESSSCYKCPKCLLNYCSLACYRSPDHLECSEAFYRSCIVQEMSLKSTNPLHFNNPEDQDSISSSDELESRFQDLDLDSASHEEILSRLSKSQIETFNSLLESKKILDLVPTWVPWWKTMESREKLNLENIYTRKTCKDLSYNLLEILFYYVITCRRFSYDFDESSWEVIKNW